MPTYYVANYGSNSNNGTSPSTPWQTVGFALGAASGTNPGLIAGDTVWIAPGTYREVITSTTLTGTSGNTIKIYGDPTFNRAWTAGSAGRVRLTNFLSDTVVPTASATLSVSGDYVDIQDLCIDGHNTGSVTPSLSTNSTLYLTGGNISVTKCSVQTTVSSGRPVGITWYCTTGKNNFTIDRCSVFAVFGIFVFSVAQTATFNMNAVVKDTVISAGNDFGIVLECASANQVTGATVYNSTIIGASQGIVLANIGQVGGTTTVLRNNLIYAPKGIGITSNASITITQSNNSIFATTNFNNLSPSTNVVSAPMLDFGLSRIQQFSMLPWFAPATGSPLIGSGTATGAPTVDIYGNTWTTFPTIGAIESKTESDVGSYQPTERNASTITIAPGSTSQSIELYLGATGLTASTSGLSAYYNRTRTADVQIPLVARTIAQAWTAGGFAEVNASTMPGVYRLDLPDAAVAAGADDVTVVVRGASGTNGAVMTIKLSSGGLTAAQTAQAVLDAVASTHNNIGSIGAFIQDKSGYSLATSQSFNTTGSVGSVAGNVTGNVVGTVGGVVGNITGSVATVANPDNIIDGVWDEQRTGHTAAGSFGEKLQTNALADEMLARDLGSGLNAGTAEERTVRSALRALRNKVNVGSSQMVVKKEDDSTDAWTATVTTTAVSSNVSGIDPN